MDATNENVPTVEHEVCPSCGCFEHCTVLEGKPRICEHCDGEPPHRPRCQWSEANLAEQYDQDVRSAMSFYPQLPSSRELREGLEDCGFLDWDNEWTPLGERVGLAIHGRQTVRVEQAKPRSGRVSLYDLATRLDDPEACEQFRLELERRAAERGPVAPYTPPPDDGATCDGWPCQACGGARACRTVTAATEPDPRDAEIERLRAAVHRDQTGLAAAMNKIKTVALGYSWIGRGEWGSYEWHERTVETLQREIRLCLDEIDERATAALAASGRLAQKTLVPTADSDAAYRHVADALWRAAEAERAEANHRTVLADAHFALDDAGAGFDHAAPLTERIATLKLPSRVLTSGRRIGRTSAQVAWLRESSDHVILARDNPATAELVAREGLAVETVMRDGKPTGDLLLRAMSPETWEDDAELVRRAVANLGRAGRRPLQRWSRVADAFGLGSTSATKLCRRLGLDPDEIVWSGEEEEVEEVDEDEDAC